MLFRHKCNQVKDGLEIEYRDGVKLKLYVVTDAVIRVVGFDKNFSLASLIKFGFIDNKLPTPAFKIKEDKEDIELSTNKLIVKIQKSRFSIEFYDKQGKLLTKSAADKRMQYFETGYRAAMELQPDERFFGFGDQTRDVIEHRGKKAIMWIRNVSSYIPIPFFMSTMGYGILVNTTWKHYFDMGAASPEKYLWETKGGNLDYYFIYGPDFKTILNEYTDLTGKPPIPPLWSFGLWFICRQNADDNEVINNALKFRDKHIPCDVLGLEPGWMKEFYDFTTKRRWHPERFKIEPWAIKENRTFISALKRMGYKFELWECNDYDLSIEAEKQAKGFLENKPEGPEGDEKRKNDALFPLFPGAAETSPPVKMDKLTNPDEPWFEHHKKFIDIGVDFFKQDASNQYAEHPDRRWANGMSDEEMHNFYPLLYSQQMYEGFKKYTNRRPLCFTPNGWAGLQRYTGTWAGDTGGGSKSVTASLNLAFCGHTYTTCDMDVTSPEGIHFGFLQPWSQINSFGTLDHPWLLGDKLGTIFKYYAQLRYQLLPYIYSYAYQSYKTGVPIIRPMPLEFPDDKNTYNLLNQYMLGREFLVGTFTNKIYLPKGEWTDYWTGEKHNGPNEVKCRIPEKRGGPLFVRSDSIIPMVEVMDYVRQKPWNIITLDIYTDGHSRFSLYEDDGISFGYKSDAFTITKFECIREGKKMLLKIGKREGTYEGIPEHRDYLFTIHLSQEPARVTGDAESLRRYNSASQMRSMQKGYYYDGEKMILQILLRQFENGCEVEVEC